MRLHDSHLKATFPAALATACPAAQTRTKIERPLGDVEALRAIGRGGDFSRILSLLSSYKGHRRAELIRLGVVSGGKKRDRMNLGPLLHARHTTESDMEFPAAEAAIEAIAAKEAAEAAEAAAAAALRALDEEKARADTAGPQLGQRCSG